MEKLKLQTTDMAERNVELLGQMFPNCLTETINADGKLVRAIDFDKLRQELACEVVEGAEERYQFTWPDKRAAIRLANAPTNKTLRPCREESVDFDNTENLYIEGDNLEVLKLLRENYLGKVKMIYIDPPYNTGNDFVYNDDFAQGKAEFEAQSGLFDEEGRRMADPMVQNTESNGRFHTDWLNMIYPRLKVAKDLLSDDGVIFISIDDNEQENLKKICDEIFGAENLLSIHHIQVRYANKSLNERKAFQECIEQVIIYAKKSKEFIANQPFEDYSLDSFCYEIKEMHSDRNEMIGNKKVTIFKKGEYEIIKHKIGRIDLLKGTWASGTVVKGNASGKYFETYLKPRKNIDGLGTLYKVDGIGEDGLGYRYFSGPNKEDATQGLFYSGVPLVRLEEIKNGTSKKYKPITNFYDFSADFGNISHEGGIAFNSGKKPIKMIKQFLNYLKGDDFLVLDYFSGSASTAHAVMQLNAEDGGNRRFIMVQLPEKTDEKSDAYKAGYKNICEIGKERIRRAGSKIKEDNASKEGIERLDVGFRVLKLDESNMADVYYTPADTPIQTTLAFDALVDNIREGRTAEDLLFQVLPECNLPLSSKIETREIHGKKVFVVEDGYLMACFDKDINEAVITAIAKEKPYYFVMCDRSIATDNVADNFDQIFNAYSKETVRRIL